MASQQGFSFPPPPPPPPPSSTQQLPQAGSYLSQNAYSHRGGSHRGGPGGGGGGFRGRGRGGMNRGARGGGIGHYPNNFRNNNNNNNPKHQGGYNTGYTPNASNASTYYANNQQVAQSGSPIYPSTNQGYNTQTQGTASSTYPSRNYNGGYRNATEGSVNISMPAYSGHPSASTGTPAVVAPPMHWGYDNTGAGGFYPGSTDTPSYKPMSYQGPSRGGYNAASGYPSQSGQKRTFASAFEKPTSQTPRPVAPPAVPSFGVPLPAKPPQPADTSRKAAKKKKRKFNQLGLTPKTEEHESSAEEDDADEESRLASVAGNAAGPLQITFRGRTSTLSTAADIQLWIEERKKRFPTQERIEEKKKAQEEAKKQREIQREEARKKQLELKEQREQAKRQSKEQKEMASNPIDTALKAKAKAEKLRKKLLKEERRLQKAEADAERARLVAEASQQSSIPDREPEKTTEQTSQSVDEKSSINASAADIQDDLSNTSDSQSSSDEDSDDDDGVPEEMSSRREGPERVPPPPRDGRTKRGPKPCRDFQRLGKCPRGSHCRYSHDLSTDGTDKPRPNIKPVKQEPAKRGLFQMLVAQEIQARDRQVMQGISWLGSQGLLDEPA